MITSKQAIAIRHFKVRIAKAVAELHTASKEELLTAAYSLEDIEDEFDEFLRSITEEYSLEDIEDEFDEFLRSITEEY